jgi:hypothetical protein
MLICCSYELVAADTTELVLHSQKVVFPYIVLNIHYISVLQMKVVGIKMRDVFCNAHRTVGDFYQSSSVKHCWGTVAGRLVLRLRGYHPVCT